MEIFMQDRADVPAALLVGKNLRSNCHDRFRLFPAKENLENYFCHHHGTPSP
jgi:hypothetical protein